MADHSAVFHNLRTLTITGSLYEYQLNSRWPRPPEVPYLRLRGYWLQHAGFSAGQRVKVTVADRCITIVPVQ